MHLINASFRVVYLYRSVLSEFDVYWVIIKEPLIFAKRKKKHRNIVQQRKSRFNTDQPYPSIKAIQ